MEKTIIDFVESEHVYLVNGVPKPSVTTILHPITATVYGSINPCVVEKARRRGEMVHQTTQLIDYGDRPMIDGEILPYIKGYLAFLMDYNPEWLGIEERVYDEYADVCGTVDRHGLIGGRYTVLDIKAQDAPSVANRISVCAQTAEYARAIMQHEAKRAALYLSSDGTYNLFDCEKYEKKREFMGIMLFDKYCELYKEMERIKSNGKRNRRI